MFDWSGENGDESGNFEILCEWQPCKDIAFTRDVHSIHLVFSRWPKINSVRPLDNMKINFKFEVEWGNIFYRYLVHKHILPLTVHIF